MSTAAVFLAEPRAVEAAFRAVFPHVGTDAHLPMLTVVRVEVAGTELVLSATDRYTAAFVRSDVTEWAGSDEKLDPLPAVELKLYAPDLRRLFAFAKGQRKALAQWSLSADRLAVELGDGSQLSIRSVELNGPDLRSVFEDVRQKWAGATPEQRAEVLNVGARHVAKFVASAEALFGPGLDVLHVWPSTPLGAIPVTIGARFAGIVMPVRAPESLNLDLGGVIAAPSAAPSAVAAAETPAALPAGESA